MQAGDSIAVRDKSKKQLRIQAALKLAAQRGVPEWLTTDSDAMQGMLSRVPDRADLSSEINENLIIELYSK